MRRAAGFYFSLGILGLNIFPATSAYPQTSDPAHKTTYYLHGRIYTNDPKAPWASALAVRDDKIFCVGSIEHIMLDCGGSKSEAEVVQLKGQFVMPGFNDAHTHLGGAGRDKLALDLKGTDSLSELQQRVRIAASQHKPGEWIVGSGWDQTRWPEKTFPHRQDLDEVSPNNPVFLVHVSGHVGVANSLALKRTEITEDTKNPTGGEIERDTGGKPTGMLKEGSAMEFVEQKIPEPTDEARRRGIELVLQELARNGVTSAQDNSAWEDFLVYHQLKEEKKLTVRITEWLPFMAPVSELQNMRSEGGTTDPWLKTGALKMVTDGALGSRTAALLEPFSDDADTSGILAIAPEKLKAMALERDKLGFQLAFHAIGDRANRVALDVFESVQRVNGTRDRRDRIEHAQVVAPEDIERFGTLHVIASMQPSHQSNDMRWAEQRVGPERVKGAYAWNSIQKGGARLAFGTDYDVEPINPFRGLYACVTRELPEGGPAGGWQPQEKISLDDCIRAYTSGSAYAQFEDGKKGELKAGEYADFIILSQDITKAAPKDLLKTEVLRTVAGGRTVYQKK
ncbi:MAG TPA: amidohydrolase [Candidatus Limnocylindrales bacterium]|nr:amidohydrolase [Candidatus Limnocylindrales bacterium]